MSFKSIFLGSEIDTAIGKAHTQGTDQALGTIGNKNPPIDADKVIQRDSAAADGLVTSTWTQIKAFLKTYFDGLYLSLTGGTITGRVETESDIFLKDATKGLIITSPAGYNWQVLITDDGAIITGRITVNFTAETQLYLGSLGTSLSTGQQTLIDDFVLMLKSGLGISSLSDKFDAIYLLANETSEAGLKNLVKRFHDATIGAATVTFSANEGFAGDGDSGYINTNYIPSTDKAIYSLNSASMGVYSRSNVAAASCFEMGVYDYGRGSQLSISYTTWGLYFSLNDAVNNQIANATATAGFYVVSRTASNAISIYHNGVEFEGNTYASTAIPEATMLILGRGVNGSPSGFSAKQISFAFIGAGLTPTEQETLYNCVQWYMTQLGTEV